jgi:transposase
MQARVEIELLREQAAAGDMVLAYVDEAGFAQVHPNRSAWTPQGERHLIEATRGKRLNVLAAMLSTGGLFSAKLWQTTNSDAFVGFLGLLKEHVGKPLTVILDNASIHKAKANAHIINFLKTQGVTLYFLPPYSPELNRIEKLWHLMKHTWMAAKCRNSLTLENDVTEILDNFGSKYKFAF